MNTSQLECFVRVADTLSFQQTAEALHISQPAVSKQIAALEDELGSRLFTRTTRTVSLTPAGEMFLPDARNILRMTYHARQTVSETRQSHGHILRIGYSDTNELARLPAVLAGLREKYPGFMPLLIHDRGENNLSQLENGQLDVCFALEDAKRGSKTRFQPLGDRPFVCVMPKAHPLAQRPLIRLEELRGELQIRVIPLPLRNRFYGEGKKPLYPAASQEERITLCDNASEAYSLVLSCFGYCLLPRFLAVPHDALAMIDCDLTVDLVHGVCYRESAMSPLLRDFLQLLRELFL